MLVNVVGNGKPVTAKFADTPTCVDLASFRPDSEQVRSFKFNPQPSMMTNPQYDYNDGKVPDDDPVTDVILALRSGRVDKAEVEQIRQSILAKAKQQNDDAKAQKMIDSLNNALGVNDTSDSNKDK